MKIENALFCYYITLRKLIKIDEGTTGKMVFIFVYSPKEGGGRG
jgi:hypothetical protein